MTNILFAVLVLGALGAAFGLVLAFAAKVFAVEVDERQEAILEILPGANCGGCGYAGCSAYAGAVVSGAPTNACLPGGSDAAGKIAAIMGTAASEVERCVALVRCSGYTGHAVKKFDYVGITDCVAAMRLGGMQGPNECRFGCIGMGTCVKACPFDAIHISNGIAVVDHDTCSGCMSCAGACPKNIIIKVPYEADITVACSSSDKGGVLKKYCDIGCLGCKKCEKTCQYDAIHVEDNLASIDYDKCVSCGDCAKICPKGLIRDSRLNLEHDSPSVSA